MLRLSENRLHLLFKCHTNHPTVIKRLLSTHIKEENSSLEDAGIISNGTIYERKHSHFDGIAKDSDLELLEKGIRKSDEMTSNFTNYMYKFQRLPPNYGSNQLITVDKELQRELDGVLASFNAPCRFAFGYGSGVFEQAGYSKNDSKPQIDIILGVTYPSHFHSINMRQNSQHYSSLKYFGSEFVSKFQQIGAGVYFNPFANINGHDVKYGVISMETLLKDIATWNTFYLAGRLQKPVKILKNDLRVQYWNQLNLKAAATLAKHYTLEKNNNKFDEFQFYKEIAALSYAGDIRYKLGGENPHKVNNIVTKNFERFQEYYKPIYKEVVLNNSFYLPKGFTLQNTQKLLLSRISKSSALQTIKGVFTAGITKSIKYAWAKKLKSFKKN
ncbi:tam41p [Saccharomyces arboricola H-6]|uniref:Phosphatidate cytidylyltransferase, mitochondrial n=1 Tax=Saccharomyces arboricola (strain H-6 / AS 2.3317 / CBS 10644) TaxID=1160507 RepID=J8Q4V0_SACAR|nr:tam41p [Saccharomyces arboricola H-6]